MTNKLTNFLASFVLAMLGDFVGGNKKNSKKQYLQHFV